jgi:peptidoglycan/xylan/chitin deacetylase (PgdA/CDA1 family)
MSDIKILLYHSVGEVDPRDELGTRIDKDKFYDQIEFLKRYDYNVWALKEAVDCIKENKPVPQHTVVITFDDGYKDNITNAAPIIEKFDLRATFFITVDYIGKTKTSPKREWQHWKCMDEGDLAELTKRGHDLGSHALHHVDLTKLDMDAKREEINRSRDKIGSLSSRTVDFFSYPYGLFDDELADILREEGYKAACTIIAGGNDSSADLYRLKRTEIINSDSIDDFKSKIG